MSELHPGWPTVLTAGAVSLRPPKRRDAREWSRVRMANEEWLAQWEPSSRQSWSARNSRAEYYRTFSRMKSAARIGIMLPFMVVYGDRVVGQMNVSNVVRGALRSCSVGYWIDSTVAGRGITPTALALVIDHCLTEVGLHRVEVDIRPENAASLRVVEKLGLRREGYYERFLDIGGAWRDHVAFAITSEERANLPVLARLSSLPLPPA
ncbi:GNAT family N-acetyltransferase [Jatrophihabitans telluris]|uniref:GNAT family N-acetyltransferase n=1 Tax=Jatrophihabitans telluris TaxID=2038343 RepID=A0ABY4R1T6_9ACTN|nr:GNAT family protein [Jatrophihabitans telluris]UQX89241.1 GNAT family N-acetyltransferase [Jatrophihabitans telluris]